MKVSKKIKNLFSVIMVLTLVLPLNVNIRTVKADGTYTQTFNVASAADINAAAQVINAAESGTYLINITADLDSNINSFDFSKNTITIKGNGHSIQAASAGPTVCASGTATIIVGLGDDSDTIIFNGTTTEDNPGVFYAWNGGTIVMNTGVTIQNNRGQNYFGGGVTVEDGTFIMNGGTISNCGIDGGSVCYGGGVAVINGGIFTMNGGTITGCYATSDYIDDYDPNRCFTAMGGGVYVTGGSSFTMNNGTITNCSATNFGGGIAEDISYGEMYYASTPKGMGYIKDSVTINDGTISGNSADSGGGIFVSGYYYSYAGPIATYSPGIGTVENPGLFVNGGTISENSASDSGGGVFIAMLRPTVTVQLHNAVISDNEALTGAGVENYGYWTQLDIDGCTITGNVASANGGGIAAQSNSSNGWTSVKDSTISSNQSGAIGAGVYYDGNSALRITGENMIQNNTYNGQKNNLNIYSATKPVYVTGSLSGSSIGLSDPTLWGDGISDQAATTSTAKLTSRFVSNNSVEPSDVFKSDHATWVVDYSEDNKEARLVKREIHAKIRGGSITLDGKIGVNLYVDLNTDSASELSPEELAKFSMKFKLNDDTAEGELSEVSATDAKYDSENDCYIFTCRVAATQMADIIDSEIIYDGDATGINKQYSVKQYASNMIGKETTAENLKKLLKPLLNYGAYSQLYFDYKTDNLANEGFEMTDDIQAIGIDIEQEMKVTYEGISGIRVTGFTMEIDDGINIMVKVELDADQNIENYISTLEGDPDQDDLFINDDLTETYNTEHLPFTDWNSEDSKTYYIILNNMPANRFDDHLTLTIADINNPSSKCTVKFSAISYGYEMINKNGIEKLEMTEAKKENFEYFLKAMCLYNQFADMYFGNNEYIKDNNGKVD